jgi:hypothetical protein
MYGEEQDVTDNILQVMCPVFQSNMPSDVLKMCHGIYKRQVNLVL